MSDFIKGVQVGDTVKKYDYEALGNLPKLLDVDETLKIGGRAADARVVGEKFTQIEQTNTNNNEQITQQFQTVNEDLTTIKQGIQTQTNTINQTNNTLEELAETTENNLKTVSDASANTLKGTAYGAVVRVDDVSPVEHEVAVKVESKNLLNLDDVVFTRCTHNADDTVISNIADSYYCKQF